MMKLLFFVIKVKLKHGKNNIPSIIFHEKKKGKCKLQKLSLQNLQAQT